MLKRGASGGAGNTKKHSRDEEDVSGGDRDSPAQLPGSSGSGQTRQGKGKGKAARVGPSPPPLFTPATPHEDGEAWVPRDLGSELLTPLLMTPANPAAATLAAPIIVPATPRGLFRRPAAVVAAARTPPRPPPHAVLGSGRYGCVVRPAMPCVDAAQDIPGNYVGKLFKSANGRLSPALHDALAPLLRFGNDLFVLPLRATCRVDSAAVPAACRTPGTWRDSAETDPVFQEVLPFAGVTLQQALNAVWKGMSDPGITAALGLEEGAIPDLFEVLESLSNVLAGIKALQQATLLHADVKSDNVVLDWVPGLGVPYRARLIDFNVAKALDSLTPEFQLTNRMVPAQGRFPWEVELVPGFQGLPQGQRTRHQDLMRDAGRGAIQGTKFSISPQAALQPRLAQRLRTVLQDTKGLSIGPSDFVTLQVAPYLDLYSFAAMLVFELAGKPQVLEWQYANRLTAWLQWVLATDPRERPALSDAVAAYIQVWNRARYAVGKFSPALGLQETPLEVVQTMVLDEYRGEVSSTSLLYGICSVGPSNSPPSEYLPNALANELHASYPERFHGPVGLTVLITGDDLGTDPREEAVSYREALHLLRRRQPQKEGSTEDSGVEEEEEEEEAASAEPVLFNYQVLYPYVGHELPTQWTEFTLLGFNYLLHTVTALHAEELRHGTLANPSCLSLAEPNFVPRIVVVQCPMLQRFAEVDVFALAGEAAGTTATTTPPEVRLLTQRHAVAAACAMPTPAAQLVGLPLMTAYTAMRDHVCAAVKAEARLASSQGDDARAEALWKAWDPFIIESTEEYVDAQVLRVAKRMVKDFPEAFATGPDSAANAVYRENCVASSDLFAVGVLLSQHVADVLPVLPLKTQERLCQWLNTTLHFDYSERWSQPAVAANAFERFVIQAGGSRVRTAT